MPNLIIRFGTCKDSKLSAEAYLKPFNVAAYTKTERILIHYTTCSLIALLAADRMFIVTKFVITVDFGCCLVQNLINLRRCLNYSCTYFSFSSRLKAVG